MGKRPGPVSCLLTGPRAGARLVPVPRAGRAAAVTVTSSAYSLLLYGSNHTQDAKLTRAPWARAVRSRRLRRARRGYARSRFRKAMHPWAEASGTVECQTSGTSWTRPQPGVREDLRWCRRAMVGSCHPRCPMSRAVVLKEAVPRPEQGTRPDRPGRLGAPGLSSNTGWPGSSTACFCAGVICRSGQGSGLSGSGFSSA